MATIDLTFSSHLAESADRVWAVVSTMDGVNAELGPFVRMTHPSRLQSLADARRAFPSPAAASRLGP